MCSKKTSLSHTDSPTESTEGYTHLKETIKKKALRAHAALQVQPSLKSSWPQGVSGLIDAEQNF